jgi:hypothetical protein
MQKKLRYIFPLLLIFFLAQSSVFAQQTKDNPDAFFLAKKKGILGRFGKMISNNSPEIEPVKVENQYLKFKGKIIRNINLISLGFESNINDTGVVKNNFAIHLANQLHKNSKDNTIRRNLFFKEGDKVYPYLLADNERYLREIIYLQDAKILVDYVEDNTDSVDVIVLTKDVFSLGAKLVISSRTKGRMDIKEENFGGTGSKLMASGFYDQERNPRGGFAAEVAKRNIRGSFVDWTTGFQTFNSTFNNGKREEMDLYTRVEKPLVTPYIPSTGAMEAAWYRTTNAYDIDSVYQRDIRYEYYDLGAWFGYSLDSKRRLYANKEIRKHRFLAVRVFQHKFLAVPVRIENGIDTFHSYVDRTGAMASLNFFKQVFYKTNFIYGFGVSEDIPEGYNLTLTGGYVNTQGVRRPYSSVDFQFNRFSKRGVYSNFTFRVGGYFDNKRFEDADLLFEWEHFTHLRKLGRYWRSRSFLTTSITAQVNDSLNAPLYLSSVYGLPYISSDVLKTGDMRATIRGESVFFNTRKILGFRLAPFIFGDMSLIKPTKMNLRLSDIYSAIGGGIRSRNENLIFGTIELRGYYFPRRYADMNEWKIELNSNIRFKFTSVFIKRPDFIVDN